MQPSNSHQSFRSSDPVWVLLAELSISDILPDQERRERPATGGLFQSLREMGMSPGCLEHIATALAGFAKEASVRHQQGKLEFPGRMRIFCQKKTIEGSKENFPESGIGGWGYFMIERGKYLPPYTSAMSHNYIYLYLYKEGQ